MCWSSRSAEQEVVAGDRVGRRDASAAADRGDQPRHRCIRSGPRGARRVVVEVRVGPAAGLGEALGEGRVDRQAGAVGRAIRPGAAVRTVRHRPTSPSPGRRSRRRTASPGARPRRGSSAARPSSARRPRGRRPPPRRASSAGRGRCPSACRPSARRGGSGPCSPTPSPAGRPSAGATSGATASDGFALQPRRPRR